MTFRVLDEAADEIAEAAEFYGDPLGVRYRASVSSCLAAIKSNPRTYARVEEDSRGREVRGRSVDSFPFRVIYEVRAAEIVVLAVAHHSRKPGYWMRRRA